MDLDIGAAKRGLLRFRCEYGQGSLFSEPLDADGVMRLLRRD